MLCVLILNINGGTYCLNSTPNDRFFAKLFHGNFIYSQNFCQNSAERRNRRRNTFRISFWCLAWDSNPGFSSNKPTHYLLDHGDFVVKSHYIYYKKSVFSRKYRFRLRLLLFGTTGIKISCQRSAMSIQKDNFRYLYAFIHILISWKETLLILILNNTYDIIDFDSP